MTESSQNEPAPLLPSQLAPDPEAKHWHDYRRKTVQETPQRLEEAAKYLAGVQALALTLFLGMLEKEEGRAGLTVATIAWLASVVASLLVVFPIWWRDGEGSTEDIRQMHRRIVRWKYGLLVVSAGLFVLALGAAALAG